MVGSDSHVSNGDQSVKQIQDQQHQLTLKKNYSAQVSDSRKNKKVVADKDCTAVSKKRGNQLSTALQQFWRIREKREPSQVSLKSSSSKVWQVKETTVHSKHLSKSSSKEKDSFRSSSKVWQAKEKTITSTDLPTSSKEKKEHLKDSSKSSAKKRSLEHHLKQNAPTYHIKQELQDGFDEPIQVNCYLCENDLAYSPTPSDWDLEFHNYPDVAILPCGHAFHMQCLEFSMSDEQLKDPPCFVCASCCQT